MCFTFQANESTEFVILILCIDKMYKDNKPNIKTHSKDKKCKTKILGCSKWIESWLVLSVGHLNSSRPGEFGSKLQESEILLKSSFPKFYREIPDTYECGRCLNNNPFLDRKEIIQFFAHDNFLEECENL